MKQHTQGRATWAALLTLVALMAIASIGRLVAANNAAPTGWAMNNRLRAKYAMGANHAYRAHCSATNTLPATGLASGDIVWGVINLTTLTEAQTPMSTTLTIAADSLTSSATPWTLGNYYVVFVTTPQADDR